MRTDIYKVELPEDIKRNLDNESFSDSDIELLLSYSSDKFLGW